MMDITLLNITVGELVEGYRDDREGGVVGYGGKLDIRPPYQREFVYKDKQRAAVIDTILKGYPLNVMYWAVRDDGTYEVIDGQQRTISVAQYHVGDFSHNGLYFHNLPSDIREKILEYKLTVYLCEGTDSERLAWFEIINIAGERLTKQELRNAVYAGPWVSDAKRYFSRTGCPAYGLGKDYVNGSPIRQEFLETAIDWISNGDVEKYMGLHQHDADALELWEHYEKIMAWIAAIFTKKRSQMKGVDWGRLYTDYADKTGIDPVAIEEETASLLMDDEVTKKSGIYPYLLRRDERDLNLRAFTPSQKQKAYEQAGGVCAVCKEQFAESAMEADHITPWSQGGKTLQENCQMLCRACNRRKAAK